MSADTEIAIQLTALLFSFFAMAEFYSMSVNGRKNGYLVTSLLFAFAALVGFISNIGTIIYGAP